MIFNLTGGGGTQGSDILVTAPAGSFVTAMNEDGERKNASLKNGIWCFSGCGTGLWTVAASLGTQSAEATVDIQEESQRFRYYVDIAYFAATIAVTYPAGSVCTCAKGSIRLTPPDTSGNAVFTVPEAGEWVISCTDGESTTSQTVTITEDGQSEAVALTYITYLYNRGDRCEALTGGWTAEQLKQSANSSTMTVSKTDNEDSMVIYARPFGNYSGGVVRTVNKIDVTGFQTLRFTGTSTAASSAQVIGISAWTEIGTDQTKTRVLFASVSDNADFDAEIDIANISGEVYLGVHCQTNNNQTAFTVTVSEISMTP